MLDQNRRCLAQNPGRHRSAIKLVSRCWARLLGGRRSALILGRRRSALKLVNRCWERPLGSRRSATILGRHRSAIKLVSRCWARLLGSRRSALILGRRRLARILGTLVVLMGAAWGPACPAAEIPTADHVVVHKAQHKLYLYSGSRLLGEYKVALGLRPVGTKEREHDFRTPEGRYFLARRNTRSDYFLSIQVSYPNKDDELRARKNRWAPGGSIMIHGLPNTPKHPATYYLSNDWTDGCIALSNSDMVEVWLRTQDNIPIDIYP